MNSGAQQLRDSAVRLSARFAKIRKARPALAELTMAELSLRTAFFDAHRKGTDAAAFKIPYGANVALTAYESVAEPLVEQAIKRATPNLYAAGAALAGERAATKHPAPEALEKAGGEEDDNNEEELAALIALFLLGVPRQLRRVFMPGLRDTLAAVPAEERAAVLRREFGRDRAGWHGPAKQLYNGSAAYMATTARTVSALRELQRRNVRKMRWVTAGDDRVCKRCRAMESVDIALDDGADLVKRMLDAKSLDDVKRIRPWHGEQKFLRIFKKAGKGNRSKNLATAGVLVPPLHGACRCVLVPVLN